MPLRAWTLVPVNVRPRFPSLPLLVVVLGLQTPSLPVFAATKPGSVSTNPLVTHASITTSRTIQPKTPRQPSPNETPSKVAASAKDSAPIESLALDEIYRRPIGPKGLEYTDRSRSLVGHKVRITGYMVRQTAPVPYSLLLAPFAIQLHEREYGLADDLPANTVHVFFARGTSPVIPHTRGPITLDGVLELGPTEEADGRISHVRLRVAAPWQLGSPRVAASNSEAPRNTAPAK